MRSYLTLGVALSALATTAAVAGPVTIQGPNSSATPYLIPTTNGWKSYSILTVGDRANNAATGHQFAGIPDGIGAYSNGDGTITVLVNHEIGSGTGNSWQNGGTRGAFVSQWTINRDTLAATYGAPFISDLSQFSYTGSDVLSRLCSADLAPISAFYNASTGLGYNGRIFLNGEESGSGGRAFAWVPGASPSANRGYQLSALGTASWENHVANPGTGNTTLVAGTEDGGNGRIQFYVGTKTTDSNPVVAAGLTNGTRYFLQIGIGANSESRTTGLPGASAINSGSLVKQSSSFTLTTNASALTGFQRPEDFAWDPNNPSVGYFVTTDQFDTVKSGQGAQVGRSRLFRVRFTDINNPTAGGTIEMLLDGTEDLQMMDNIAVGQDGKVYIQEDPGNQRYAARIFAYDPTTGTITQAFQHDPRRFGTLGGLGFGPLSPTAPFTQDEESSGIVEVTNLFRGSLLDPGGRNTFFLADVQAHYGIAQPLYEGGQLLLLVRTPEPAAFALFGMGVVGAAALRRRARRG